MQYVRAQFKKRRYSHPPAWVDVVRVAYHKYGLKYVALFLALSAYSFMGAGVFLFFEKPAELERFSRRQRTFEDLRQTLVRQLLDNLFNDTEKPLIFVDAAQIEAIVRTFGSGLRTFEDLIADYNSKHSMEPLLRWDLWTALIYAWTVITTIGYGHLFPLTVGGRIATMLYAIVGIPLMLTALSSVGKLLTKGMKYPFIIIKRLGRRMFKYCTKMTREQIFEADEKDKATLEVFDLPIPVAIALVVGWIFICSAIILFWETDWDYLVAFYFFFISLSTIGFGDVVPSQPYYLLLMFGNTMVGMALVSMLLNLIQGKLEPISKADDDEEDPFAVERNGLRRAFRKASLFSDIPWLAETQSTTGRNQSIIEESDQIDPNIGDSGSKIFESKDTSIKGEGNKTNSKRKKRFPIGKKSKQEGAAGGAAVSALSTFLAPFFVAYQKQEEKANQSDFGQIEKQIDTDQLIIIDEDAKIDSSPRDDQRRNTSEKEPDEMLDINKLKPLKKTVSFQENELAMPSEQNFQQLDQIVRNAENVPEPQVVLATKSSAPVRAVAVFDAEDGNANTVPSVRVRRMNAEAKVEEKAKKKKKRRTMSMREARHSERLQKFDSLDIYDTDEGEKISTYTPPIVEVQKPKRRKTVRRAGTTPEAEIDRSIIAAQVNESHSACSICAYHPLDDEVADPNVRLQNRLGKKMPSKPSPKSDHQNFDTVPTETNDLIKFENRHRQSESPKKLQKRDKSRKSKSASHIHPSLSRENAVDVPSDNLPDDESSLFAYLDAAVAVSADSSLRTNPRRRHDFPWHRHSIGTDSALDFIPPSLPQSHSEHRQLRSNLVSNSETQTMISFPSQDSDSRVSVSGERGTTRLLPESVSFTEINRLVNLNINAEILRNELAALAMAEMSSAGNMGAYRHVLSWQEMLDQINHEASLPRGRSYY